MIHPHAHAIDLDHDVFQHLVEADLTHAFDPLVVVAPHEDPHNRARTPEEFLALHEIIQAPRKTLAARRNLSHVSNRKKYRRMGNVIYLTGAPASGKSTLTRGLAKRINDLKVFEYGRELTSYLATGTPNLTQERLRSQSSQAATPEDIAAVDLALLKFVSENREAHHVIIDSHPVTRERYGFRVTPFKLDQFQALQPSQIWMLYTAPEIALDRIRAAPEGRPAPSLHDLSLHTSMQSSVAITYGMYTGSPTYVIDSDRSTDELADELAECLQRF